MHWTAQVTHDATGEDAIDPGAHEEDESFDALEDDPAGMRERVLCLINGLPEEPAAVDTVTRVEILEICRPWH